MVFAGVLATGAATGAWRDGGQAVAGPLEAGSGQSAGAVDAVAQDGDMQGVRRAVARGKADADELVSRSGDRWSVSYTAREYEGLRRSLDGRYVGVGIAVTKPHGGAVRVARVAPGSPAAEAGVRAGDRLHAIDGEPVAHRPVTEVVALLRGSPVSRSAPEGSETTAEAPLPDGEFEQDAAEAGSKVGVEIVRGGLTRQETLRRALLSTDAVTVDRVAGAARIKISSFTRGSGAQLREAVDQLPDGTGILLDLRGNSGGLVAEAARAASAFLDGGLVATYDDGGEQRALHAESGGDTERPLVVLVDGGTMSAAELLAGALQDRGRAVVAGSRTFGKGSVQMPHKLPDGSVAELTVGQYATPSGRRVGSEGITPDLMVGASDDAESRGRTVLSGLEARS